MSEAPAPSAMLNRHRRYSGIPRPASGSSRRATSSTRQLLVPCDASNISVPKNVQPAHHTRPPRSDSSRVYEDKPRVRDLSGVWQQLDIRNFSTQSVQGLDAVCSPRTATVRSLMRPIGPPLPRSHTMGELAFNSQASSPARRLQTVDSRDRGRPAASPEIDVVDALHESRMTQEEVKLLNQAEKERQLNRARLLKKTTTTQMASSPSHVETATQESERTSSTISPPSAASRLLTRDHVRRRTADINGKNVLRIDPIDADTNQFPQAYLQTPKPALVSVSPSNKIDARHVYFSEPTSYWTGRYIALCDKFKTHAVARVTFLDDKQTALEDEQHRDSKVEPFETVEQRRTRSVLEDLRSCCRSEQALKSFGMFEDLLLMMRSGTPTATNKPMNVSRNTAGVTDVPITIGKIQNPWLIGSTSDATVVASQVISDSELISDSEMPSVAVTDKSGSLVKSKTTGNLAAMGHEGCPDKAHIKVFAYQSSSRIRHIRQPSSLSIQAQMNARALREREERAARRVEETKRRLASRSVSGVIGRHEDEKAPIQLSSRMPETCREHTNLSTSAVQLQRTHAQPRARRRSLARISSSDSSSEKHLVRKNDNRNISIASPNLQSSSKDEALAEGPKASIPQELKRRTNRQSSGEMLRNMVSGGLKGVRRMGRSLTGRSELEEVGQSFDINTSGSDLGGRRWPSRSDGAGAAL